MKSDTAQLLLLRRLLWCCALLLFGRSTVYSQKMPDPVETLVAPIYISDEQVESVLNISNGNTGTANIVVRFYSLEGQIVAEKALTLGKSENRRLEIGAVAMRQHSFASLGSITILANVPRSVRLTGYVSIDSRRGGDTVHLKEDLQTIAELDPSVISAVVPATFSIPVLGIRSTSPFTQHISISCFEGTGRRYESDLSIPANMTLLLNGCIGVKNENRTYEQILKGDIGVRRGSSSIQVITDAVQGGIAMWGFASNGATGQGTTPVVGIEFK